MIPVSGRRSLAQREASRAVSPYRVMLVDDSAVVRGLIASALESAPEIAVVLTAGNGQMAVDLMKRHEVEVVVLDIEMPVMDGLTALPLLLAARPGIAVIIASTLTRRGAEVALKALAAGATDYVTKPGTSSLTTADAFKLELVQKVKGLAEARRKARGIAQPQLGPETPAPRPAPGGQPAASLPLSPRAAAVAGSPALKLRPLPNHPPEVMAIGASTGGPAALFRVLGALPTEVQQPIFITQHMPATFTAIFADHLTRISGRAAAEGIDGEVVRNGRIYVAPGDHHMLIEPAAGGAKVVRLSKQPPENFCRPAVDPMLRSLAASYGAGVLCAILTGMGHDGLAGAATLIGAGGTLIAQDEASSIVWGMPGAVATAGLCSAVLPIDEIGPFLCRAARRMAA